jgi:hypothetical protein
MRRVLTEQVVDALAVIPPQAAAAEALVPGDVEAARRAVAAVQRSAEGALDALRRLLTVLPEAVASPYAPQPTLDDVRLEAARRAAGGQVRFSIARDLGRVPAGVQLVVHHAMLAGLGLVDRAGGEACVRIGRRGEAIVLSMVMERAAEPADAESALAGVALRAQLYGGALRWTAGRRLTLTIPDLDPA